MILVLKVGNTNNLARSIIAALRPLNLDGAEGPLNQAVEVLDKRYASDPQGKSNLVDGTRDGV